MISILLVIILGVSLGYFLFRRRGLRPELCNAERVDYTTVFKQPIDKKIEILNAMRKHKVSDRIAERINSRMIIPNSVARRLMRRFENDLNIKELAVNIQDGDKTIAIHLNEEGIFVTIPENYIALSKISKSHPKSIFIIREVIVKYFEYTPV